ncbi:MAG TPA: cytochrome c maturation protein CcmE [Ktedonobacterales bacterium]
MTIDVAEPIRTQRPRRRAVRWSFVIAGLLIAGAVLYLVLANTRASAEYYMTMGELRQCTTCSSQAVRVAGQVATGTIQRDNKTQVLRFTMTDGKLSMPVVYGGIVPDAFKPGLTVVVEGHIQDGTFQAKTLLAKCPSKFQSATPGSTGK